MKSLPWLLLMLLMAACKENTVILNPSLRDGGQEELALKKCSEEIECLLDSKDTVYFYTSPLGFDVKVALPYTRDSVKSELTKLFYVTETSPLRHHLEVWEQIDSRVSFLFEGWVDKDNTYVYIRPVLDEKKQEVLELFSDTTLLNKTYLYGIQWYDEAILLDGYYTKNAPKPYAKVMFTYQGELHVGYVLSYTGSPYGFGN